MNNTTKPITIIRQKNYKKIMRIIIMNAILEICTKFNQWGAEYTKKGGATVGDQNGTVGFPWYGFLLVANSKGLQS